MKSNQNNLVFVTVMIAFIQAKVESFNIDAKEDLLKIITHDNTTVESNVGIEVNADVDKKLKVKPKTEKQSKCLDSIADDFNPTDRIICVKRTKDGPLQTINKSDGKQIKEDDLEDHVHIGSDEAYHVTLPLPEVPQVPDTTSKSLEDVPVIFEEYLKKSLSSAMKTNLSSKIVSLNKHSSKAHKISDIKVDNIEAIKSKTNSLKLYSGDKSSNLMQTYIDVVKRIKPEYNWTVKPLTKIGTSLNESNNPLLKYLEYFLSKTKNKTLNGDEFGKAVGTSDEIARYVDSNNTGAILPEKQLSEINSDTREYLETGSVKNVTNKKAKLLSSKSIDVYKDNNQSQRNNENHRGNIVQFNMDNNNMNRDSLDSETKIKLEENFDYNTSPNSEDEDLIVNIDESLSNTETNHTKSNIGDDRVNHQVLSDKVHITFNINNNSESNSEHVDVNSTKINNNISNELTGSKIAKWKHVEKFDEDNSEEIQSSKDDIVYNDNAMATKQDAQFILHKFSNKKTLFRKVVDDDNYSEERDHKELFKTFPPFEIVNQSEPTKQRLAFKTKVIYEDLAKPSKSKINKLKRTTRSNVIVATENMPYEPDRIKVSKNENNTLPKESVKGSHKITWTIIPSEKKGGRYRRLKFEVRPQVERVQTESSDEEIVEELIEHGFNIDSHYEKEQKFDNRTSKSLSNYDSDFRSEEKKTVFGEDKAWNPKQKKISSSEADESAEDTTMGKTTSLIDMKTHSTYSIPVRKINHESDYPGPQANSNIRASTMDSGHNNSASKLLEDYQDYNENNDEAEDKPEIKRIPAAIKYLNRFYSKDRSYVLPKPPHILKSKQTQKISAIEKKFRANNINKKFGLKYEIRDAKSKKANNKNVRKLKNKQTTLKPAQEIKKIPMPKVKPKVMRKSKNKPFNKKTEDRTAVVDKFTVINLSDLTTNSNVQNMLALQNKISHETTDVQNPNKTLLINITKILSTANSKHLKNENVTSTNKYDNSTIIMTNNEKYYHDIRAINNNNTTTELATEVTTINHQKLNSTVTSRENKANFSEKFTSSTIATLKTEITSFKTWREVKKFETSDAKRIANKNVSTTEETEYMATRPRPDDLKGKHPLKPITTPFLKTTPEIQIDYFDVDSIETVNVETIKERPTSIVKIEYQATSKTLNLINTTLGRVNNKNSTVNEIDIRSMNPVTEGTATVNIQFQSTASDKASQNNSSTTTKTSLIVEDKDSTNRTANYNNSTSRKKNQTIYPTAVTTNIPLNVKALNDLYNESTILAVTCGPLTTAIEQNIKEIDRNAVLPVNMSNLTIINRTKILRPLSTVPLNKTKCSNDTIFGNSTTDITTIPSSDNLFEENRFNKTKFLGIETLISVKSISERPIITSKEARTSLVVDDDKTTAHKKIKETPLRLFLVKNLTTTPLNQIGTRKIEATIEPDKFLNQMQEPKDSTTSHKLDQNSNKRKNLVETEGGAQDIEECDYETFENEPIFTPEADESLITTQPPITKEYNHLNSVKSKSIVSSVLDSLLNRTDSRNETCDMKEIALGEKQHLNKIVKIFKSLMKTNLDVLNNKSLTDDRHFTASRYYYVNDREIRPRYHTNSSEITDLRKIKYKGPRMTTSVMSNDTNDKVIPINTATSSAYLRLDPAIKITSEHTFQASTYYDDTDYYDSESLRNEFEINSKIDANTTSLVEEILNFVLHKTTKVTKKKKPSFNYTINGYKDIVKSLLNVLLDKTMNKEDSIVQDKNIDMKPKFPNLTINSLSPMVKSKYKSVNCTMPDLEVANAENTTVPNIFPMSENITNTISNGPSKVHIQKNKVTNYHTDSIKYKTITSTRETLKNNKSTINNEIQYYMTALSAKNSHKTLNKEFKNLSNHVTSRKPILKNHEIHKEVNYSTQQSVSEKLGNNADNFTPTLNITSSTTAKELISLRILVNNESRRQTESVEGVFVNATDPSAVIRIINSTDTTKFEFIGNTDTNFTENKRLQYDIDIKIIGEAKAYPNLIYNSIYFTTAKPKGVLIDNLADKILNSFKNNSVKSIGLQPIFVEKELLKVLPLNNASNADHYSHTVMKNITTNDVTSATKSSEQNSENVLQSIDNYTEVILGNTQVLADKISNISKKQNKAKNEVIVHNYDVNTSHFFSEQSMNVVNANAKFNKYNETTAVTKSNSNYTDLSEVVSNPNITNYLQPMKLINETENFEAKTKLLSNNTVNTHQDSDVEKQVVNNAFTETRIIGIHNFKTTEAPKDKSVAIENNFGTIESSKIPKSITLSSLIIDVSEKPYKFRDTNYNTNSLSIDITTTSDMIPIKKTDVIPLPNDDMSYVRFTNQNITEKNPFTKAICLPTAVIGKAEIQANNLNDFFNLNKHSLNLSEDVISTTETDQIPKYLLVKGANHAFNTTIVPIGIREIRFSELINGNRINSNNLSNANPKKTTSVPVLDALKKHMEDPDVKKELIDFILNIIEAKPNGLEQNSVLSSANAPNDDEILRESKENNAFKNPEIYLRDLLIAATTYAPILVENRTSVTSTQSFIENSNEDVQKLAKYYTDNLINFFHENYRDATENIIKNIDRTQVTKPPHLQNLTSVLDIENFVQKIIIFLKGINNSSTNIGEDKNKNKINLEHSNTTVHWQPDYRKKSIDKLNASGNEFNDFINKVTTITSESQSILTTKHPDSVISFPSPLYPTSDAKFKGWMPISFLHNHADVGTSLTEKIGNSFNGEPFIQNLKEEKNVSIQVASNENNIMNKTGADIDNNFTVVKSNFNEINNMDVEVLNNTKVLNTSQCVKRLLNTDSIKNDFIKIENETAVQDETSSPLEYQNDFSPNASVMKFDDDNFFAINTAEDSKIPMEHVADIVESVADVDIDNHKYIFNKTIPNRETYLNRSVPTIKEYLNKTVCEIPNRETYVNRTTSSVDKYLNTTLSQNVNAVLAENLNMTSILQLYKKLWETYNSLLGNVTTLNEILPVVSLNKTIPDVVNLYRNKTDKNISDSDINITYTNENIFNNDTYEDIEVVMEQKFRNKTYRKLLVDKIEKVEDKLINTRDLIKEVYTDRTNTITEPAENTVTVMDFENKVYDDVQENEEGMYEVQEPDTINLQEMSKIESKRSETDLENMDDTKYIPFNDGSFTLTDIPEIATIVNKVNSFKPSVTTETNFIVRSRKLSEGVNYEVKPAKETVVDSTTIQSTHSSVTFRKIPARKKSITNKGTKLDRKSFFADVYSKMAFPSIISSVNNIPISNKYWDRLLESEIERRKQFPIIQTYATEAIMKSEEILPYTTITSTHSTIPLQNYAIDKTITYPEKKVKMRPQMKPIILIDTIKEFTTNTPEIKLEHLKTDTTVDYMNQEVRIPIDSFFIEQDRPTNKHFSQQDKTPVATEQIITATSKTNTKETQELTEKITIKKWKNSEARKFSIKPGGVNKKTNEVNFDYEVITEADKFINNLKDLIPEQIQINDKAETGGSAKSVPIDACGIYNSPLTNVREGNGRIETYPWLGVLIYPRGKQRLVTTVVLITTQLVIASASDINKLPKKDFRKCAKVILGANCTGPRINVVNYNYHKDFSEYSSALALVQIDAFMLKYSLRPICPPPKRFYTDARFYTFVMPDDCRNSTVQLYEMDHVPTEVCRKYYRGNSLDSMWPRHSACGKARRGGQCIWPSGSILAVRQDQRWHLLGFGITSRGCEHPSRYIDYGMYADWVDQAATRMGQPAITRIAPNQLIFRRSLHEIQRFGLCDNEEMEIELFTDSSEVRHSAGSSQNSGIISYNLTLLQNVDYQCIVFQAYNLNAMDLRKSPSIEIRRYCPSAPQYCYGGGLVRIDFQVVIHFYDAIKYKIQAYGKTSRILDPKILIKDLNKMEPYPPIPHLDNILANISRRG